MASPEAPTVKPSQQGIKGALLVDRVAEMETLIDLTERSARGTGGVALLVGEAGIGKTRLGLELKMHANRLGVKVLLGSYPGLLRSEDAPPYGLWVAIIRDFLRTSTPELLQKTTGSFLPELSKLVPEIRQLAEQTSKQRRSLGIRGWMRGPEKETASTPLAMGPENERIRLLEAVSQFIIGIARLTPLIIFLDDLQWADQSSLLLLHHLARSVSEEPITLLGAYRDTDIDERHPLHHLVTELNRERLVRILPIRRLPAEETAELITRLLGQDKFSTELARTIYDRTAGNPFFIEEVIKSLVEEGVIDRTGNEWHLKESRKIEFPSTIRELIRKRLGRVEREHLQVLSVASIIGKDFGFEILQTVTGLPEFKLLDIMENMIRTGIVTERRIGVGALYSFSDSLLQNVVSEDISITGRTKLHGLVGNALEKAYGKRIDEHQAELAHHFLEAGNNPKALDYFLQAGEKAMAVHGYKEAYKYFQSALQISSNENTAERARILETLGEVARINGDYHEALGHLESAITLRRNLGGERRLAELHTKRASIYWDHIGMNEKASEEHEAALRLLEGTEGPELARLYEDIGHMQWRRGNFEKSHPFLEKATDLSLRLREWEPLAKAYADMGVVKNDSSKRMEFSEKALKIALENDYIELALRLYNNLGVESKYRLGDFQRAFEYHKKGLELGSKVGCASIVSKLNSELGGDYFHRGEYQKAIEIEKGGLGFDIRTSSAVATARLAYIGWAYLRMGELDDAERYLKQGLEMSESRKEYAASLWIKVLLGDLALEREDFPDALKHFEESVRMTDNANDTSGRIEQVYFDLALLYLKTGEENKASKLIEETYIHAVQTNNSALLPFACELKGMGFRAAKNWNEAIRFFEKSVQLLEAMKGQTWLPFDLAETLYEYGLVYLQRNETGDREKAWRSLNQSLEIFQRIGSKKRIEKIMALRNRGALATPTK